MTNKFVKKNGLAKLWLKLTDREKYNWYKVELRAYRMKNYIDEHEILDSDQIKALAKRQGTLHFLHDGNAGDIIYSLPSVREARKITGAPVHLYLRLDQPHGIPSHYTHPLGGVMLNQQMFGMLHPLLTDQPYLEDCHVYAGQRIDIDLNAFRESGIFLDRGNIARWYNYLTGLHPGLSEPWLRATPDARSAGHIVIARSSRYRNPYINYSFLRQYERVLFLGVESEYQDIRKSIPDIEWVRVKDFREMAGIIAGARFFIGNQSLPFSIAEGLKVNRILEISVEAPNVLPEGGNAFDFYFQHHFEWLVNELYGQETLDMEGAGSKNSAPGSQPEKDSRSTSPQPSPQHCSGDTGGQRQPVNR